MRNESNQQTCKCGLVDPAYCMTTPLHSADFEAKMTELADNFREARQFYVSQLLGLEPTFPYLHNGRS